MGNNMPFFFVLLSGCFNACHPPCRRQSSLLSVHRVTKYLFVFKYLWFVWELISLENSRGIHKKAMWGSLNHRTLVSRNRWASVLWEPWLRSVQWKLWCPSAVVSVFLLYVHIKLNSYSCHSELCFLCDLEPYEETCNFLVTNSHTS